MTSDTELLRRYVSEHSESAFTELVHQRLGMVYGVALRRTRNPHLAEEACQRVFTALARKAPALAARPVLAGWLYRSAQLAAAEAVRNEARRARREQEFAAAAAGEEAPVNPDWDKVRPLLDEAVAQLSAEDRDAVVMRFVDGQPYAAVGARLGASENAARMRVNRAMDKLRGALARRGVESTVAAMSLAFAAEVSAAVPAGLAAQIGSGACAAAGGAGLGTAGLVTLMSSAKVAGILGLAALALGGTALYEAHASKMAAAALGAVTQERDGLRASLLAAQRRAAVPTPKPPPAAAEGGGANDGKLRSVAGGLAARHSASVAAPTDPQKLAYYQRRYGAFAQQRHLTPEATDRLYSILWNWDTMREDLQAQLRAQGLTLTPEAARMRGQLQKEYEIDPLVSLLGKEGERDYMTYEDASFYRTVATAAVQGLGLSDDQVAKLAAALRANRREEYTDPTSLGGAIVFDWNAVAAASAAYLSSAQAAALQAWAARQKP